MNRTSIFRMIMILSLILYSYQGSSQGTGLLRQPSVSANTFAFAYGGDIWVSDLNTSLTTRITSTPAVESNPQLERAVKEALKLLEQQNEIKIVPPPYSAPAK